jgi:hypothetical protein
MIKSILQWDESWQQRFPIRITRRQKEAFLQEVAQELEACHFETELIEVRTLIKNRLLTTKCEKPRIIFTAHYDTPTIMPFWFPPFFYLFGHTRQLTAMFFLLLLIYLPTFLLPAIPSEFPWLWLSLAMAALPIIFALSMVTLFIPNPRNREDNTSGVIGLMALANWLKDKPDLREQVQLVFLDNEELGLLGSRGLKRVWDKRQHPYAEAAMINLDCVSRGDVPLIVYHHDGRLAKRVAPFVQTYLPQARPIDMTWLPLSDNYTFKQEKAIDISFADKTLIPGGYYIPRIHTPSDNDFTPERLALLLQGLADFVTHETNGTINE